MTSASLEDYRRGVTRTNGLGREDVARGLLDDGIAAGVPVAAARQRTNLRAGPGAAAA